MKDALAPGLAAAINALPEMWHQLQLVSGFRDGYPTHLCLRFLVLSAAGSTGQGIGL